MSQSCSTSIPRAALAGYKRNLQTKLFQSTKDELGQYPLSTRTLSFRAFGSGHPILFFPGNLNSRLFRSSWETTEELAAKHNLRVVMIDRPGVGGSTLPVSETYSDFARTVEEFVLDSGITSFGLIGFSSGGPYAVACASRLAENVSGLVLVSADGEYANPDIGVDIPSIYGGNTRDNLLKNFEAISQANAANLDHSYDAMKNETRRKIAKADLAEAVKKGFQGVSRDCILETQRWDFSIPLEWSFPVHVFHGTLDESVPVKVAQWYASILPNATLHLIEGENHSMIRRKWEDVLCVLEAGAKAGL